MKSFDDWFSEQGSSPSPEEPLEAPNLKWEIYEEIRTKDGVFIRQGDIVSCALKWMNVPFDLTIEQINLYHRMWPETYPEFDV